MNDATSSLAWRGHSPACYYEPRVHDHQLYFQLRDLNLYVLLPLAVLGVIFNASAMIFLYRPPKITSGVFVYLKALLILDHCLLLITASNALLPQICDLHHSQNHTLYGLCTIERKFLKHTLPRVQLTVNTMHVWTIAALSAHRYWKISRPVIARLYDTVGRAHTMLFIMFAIVFLFRSPIFFLELQFRFRPSFLVNTRIAATEVLSPYRFAYSILDPLFSNIIPFIWMSIFSLLTLYEIFHSRNLSYQHITFDVTVKHNVITQPINTGFRKKADTLRHKQELRATISIVLIIILYLCLHSLELYTVARKWQLLISHQCPRRSDYFQSYMANVLSMISATVNAFVFIAFTNRLRKYVRKLIRKTSRTLSNSSEPPLSPKTTTTIEGHHHGSAHHHHYRNSFNNHNNNHYSSLVRL